MINRRWLFSSYVARGKPNDCWPWLGARTPNGYGQFRLAGDTVAHRIAFKLHNKVEISPGAFICHHCDNPPCCNPRHLYEGDARTNARDMVTRGRNSRTKRTKWRKPIVIDLGPIALRASQSSTRAQGAVRAAATRRARLLAAREAAAYPQD